MASPYTVTITNGKGEENVLNASYNVTSNVSGYDDSTLTPKTITVPDATNSYNFTIGATGTLTIHVTEEGTSAGTPIVGATFQRTDSEGTTYGPVITTDASGNAVFPNVPFAETGAPVIYYKQLTSDGNHNFDSEVQSTAMTSQTSTIELQNETPALRTFTLTDANYENLKIADGVLTLTSN